MALYHPKSKHFALIAKQKRKLSWKVSVVVFDYVDEQTETVFARLCVKYPMLWKDVTCLMPRTVWIYFIYI